ncbi:MAG TPA: hypothetical protein PKD64_13765 [Pirellulaceae bacterium]|nr:hypothetical protein [Pirellulaceae bacterium]HMO93253.1 hypothetical protein [Pirellulaceae bacterium]HMP69118.1 hypothetical protein [Pirellulaceae bacterium]
MENNALKIYLFSVALVLAYLIFVMTGENRTRLLATKVNSIIPDAFVPESDLQYLEPNPSSIVHIAMLDWALLDMQRPAPPNPSGSEHSLKSLDLNSSADGIVLRHDTSIVLASASVVQPIAEVEPTLGEREVAEEAIQEQIAECSSQNIDQDTVESHQSSLARPQVSDFDAALFRSASVLDNASSLFMHEEDVLQDSGESITAAGWANAAEQYTDMPSTGTSAPEPELIRTENLMASALSADANATKDAIQISDQPILLHVPKLYWPRAESLCRDLTELADFEITQEWAVQTLNLLKILESIEINPCSGVQSILRQLEEQVVFGNNLLRSFDAEILQQPAWYELYAIIVRANHGLERRLHVWWYVSSLSQLNLDVHPAPHPHAVLNSLDSAYARLRPYKNLPDWAEYFEFERLSKAYSIEPSTPAQRQLVARRVYGRVTSPCLTDAQRKFCREILGDQLIHKLQDACCQNVDFHRLLSTIEAYESEACGVNLFNLNSEFLNLQYSRHIEFNRFARVLDNIYRNANIRICISPEFVNRTLPRQPEISEPMTDRMLGAQVLGNNRIQNRLNVDFIPHPEELRLRLTTNGTVLSRTRALHSGFTFHNSGNSRFTGVSEIAITKSGLTSDVAQVSASTSQLLLGIRSRFDELPLLGWAARNLAEQQQRNSASVANRLVEEKLKNMTKARFEEEVGGQLEVARELFLQRVITPLNLLELEPTPIELQTSQDAAVIRYRIAGRDQMAAFEARPDSVPGNLLNMQVHQSAINNLLGKMNVNGQRFTPDEFVEHFKDLMGSHQHLRYEKKSHEHDARLTFAAIEGIHVGFINQRVELTLNLSQFSLGKTQRWRNISVTGIYIPQVDGLKIHFVQDPERGLRLNGHRLGIADELALRTVFNTAFPESFSMPSLDELVPPQIPMDDLVISQLVFNNGWVGISISSISQPVGEQHNSHSRNRRQEFHRFSNSGLRVLR